MSYRLHLRRHSSALLACCMLMMAPFSLSQQSSNDSTPFTPTDDFIPCALTTKQAADLRLLPAATAIGLQKAAATAESLSDTISNLFPAGAGQINTEIESVVSAASQQSPIKASQIFSTTITGALAKSQELQSNSDKRAQLAEAANKDISSSLDQVSPARDVLCTAQITSYKNSKDVFGRRVAKRYLAIQVRISNTNATSEYLLHDI